MLKLIRALQKNIAAFSKIKTLKIDVLCRYRVGVHELATSQIEVVFYYKNR